MLLATSHGVPFKMIRWSLPQSVVAGWLLATWRGGRADTETRSAISATFTESAIDWWIKQKSKEWKGLDAFKALRVVDE